MLMSQLEKNPARFLLDSSPTKFAQDFTDQFSAPEIKRSLRQFHSSIRDLPSLEGLVMAGWHSDGADQYISVYVLGDFSSLSAWYETICKEFSVMSSRLPKRNPDRRFWVNMYSGNSHGRLEESIKKIVSDLLVVEDESGKNFSPEAISILALEGLDPVRP